LHKLHRLPVVADDPQAEYFFARALPVHELFADDKITQLNSKNSHDNNSQGRPPRFAKGIKTNPGEAE
jgi:hypothetical protein